MKKVNFLTLLLLLFIVACQSTTQKDDEALSLFSLMTGSFDSQAQSEADSAFFNISLHMYPIWEDKGGEWLYVEQALASTQDRPYRQRVYQLKAEDDGSFKSIVYTLEDESRFVGKWKETNFFDQFDESVLNEREGCAVFMKRINETTFEGATQGKGCLSTLRGANYASSKVKITADKIESWDQGFDSNDQQVWGAEKGGYVFDKKSGGE